MAPQLALGPRRRAGAVEFALHAAARAAVWIDCYEIGGAEPLRSLELEPDDGAPEPFRLWRGASGDLPEAFEYLVRVDGGPPLLDPYAPGLSGGESWGRSDDALAPGVGRRYRGLCVAQAPPRLDVSRPAVAAADRVVYELHVRGFTRHPSSRVARPGTYAGVIEKIPYLRELGVTSVELMPVAEFDETENPRRDPRTGERLFNFWGYSPVSFFAPKAAYAASREPGAAEAELRELVDACHAAGLEVILDVVFNHTAEGGGGAGDPLHGLRALDATGYYLTAPGSGAPLDVTGCGNSVNCNHPVTARLILDALRSWVRRFGVDGFRFDLAAVFFRGQRGEPLERSPLAEAIAEDPELAGRLLIAEPWDATGYRPAAGFPAPWLEWDGEFRDAVRRHVGGIVREPRPLALRLAGAGPDAGRTPAARAVRFAACHDGRPLADVVAYRHKHNQANGEGNRDGWDGEVAWNGGVEGATGDAGLTARRERQVLALLALVAAAPGTAQLTAGDERGRTQWGNSNAWCRDDEIGWLLWTPHDTAERRRAFVAELLRARRRLGLARTPASAALVAPYRGATSGSVAEDAAFALLRREENGELHLVAANPTDRAVEIPLPASPAGMSWKMAIATALPGSRGDSALGITLELAAGAVALLVAEASAPASGEGA